MNHLDVLIEQLCPEGVPTRSLGDLEDSGAIKLGRGNVISRTDLQQDPGDYPVYSSSAVGAGEFGRYGKFMFEDERITWSVDGGGKFFYRPSHRYSVTNVCGWISVREPSTIQTKFLYYSLINAWSKKIYNYTVKAHPSVIRVDYVLSIPPLEVQQEIVRILDTFTELDAALDAELEARKKQYEHYRDIVLSFNGDANVNWKPLGELGTFTRGKGLPKEQLVQSGLPAIHYGQLYTTYKTWTETTVSCVAEENLDSTGEALPGDLLMTMSDVTPLNVGKAVAWVGDHPIRVGGDVLVFRHQLDPKFLSLYFETGTFQNQKIKMVTGATVRHISASSLSKIKIPVPSAEKQRYISGQLEALHNLIFNHLPAEIEERRKQYEHYRYRLLTFKELAA